MDVRLSPKRVIVLVLFFSLFIHSCGKEMDVGTEYGRQARIDEANMLLSKGYCQLALETISPVFDSIYRTEEVTILKAAAYACLAGFNFLGLTSNVASISNKYKALAKSMPAASGSDFKIANMFSAVDVLTENNTILNASQRSAAINSYMVFLQLGVIGVIMSGYGAPNTTTGDESTVNFRYSVTVAQGRQAGDMSNEHACAIGGALATIVDSAASASLGGNADITSAINTFNGACSTAGYSCANLNKNRMSCTGLQTDVASVAAGAIVTRLSADW